VVGGGGGGSAETTGKVGVTVVAVAKGVIGGGGAMPPMVGGTRPAMGLNGGCVDMVEVPVASGGGTIGGGAMGLKAVIEGGATIGAVTGLGGRTAVTVLG